MKNTLVNANKIGKMKICYLADGQSIHTQKWVKYFSEHGHEVHLISFRPFKNGKVFIHMLRRKLPIQDLDYFLQIPAIRNLLAEIKPDILHAHYITSFGFLGACSNLHPFIVSALGTDILITPFRSFLHKMLTRFVLKRAELIIADAQISVSRMVELGIPAEKIHIIPSGIDPLIFYPSSRQDYLPILVSVRQHKPLYNLDIILRALKILRANGHDVKLLLAGDGPLRQELEKLARKLDIKQSVEFLGNVPPEKLGDLYRQSSIYISIPRSDATSISLLEAMACGAFPIVSDIPANREWITEGENGLLVPPDNPSILAQKITQALDDPDLRIKAVTVNQKTIKERGLWEKNMEIAAKLYFQLLKDKQTRIW